MSKLVPPHGSDSVLPLLVAEADRAEMLITRTTEGEIGILADHEPTMAALSTGSTVITPEEGDRITLAIHGGFLQILANQVTLLTDRAEITEGDRDAAAELARKVRRRYTSVPL